MYSPLDLNFRETILAFVTSGSSVILFTIVNFSFQTLVLVQVVLGFAGDTDLLTVLAHTGNVRLAHISIVPINRTLVDLGSLTLPINKYESCIADITKLVTGRVGAVGQVPGLSVAVAVLRNREVFLTLVAD